MKNLVYFLLVFALVISCQTKNNIVNLEEVKQQVLKAEHDFDKAAREKGVEAAFLAFAAEDAVINRGEKIYKGKGEIKDYFSHSTLTDVELSWQPEFVDVSNDGTLAYTYGPYTFRAKDKEGNTISAKGLFHTVWKRQGDNSWKFVYD
ncbi:MAG: nuclear transport factor 2 family protein [Cyclobacteriaceae bacterium]|nr:nuclear transport factor 2 family protein [Cyclobacteriaceae bacterium]